MSGGGSDGQMTAKLLSDSTEVLRYVDIIESKRRLWQRTNICRLPFLYLKCFESIRNWKMMINDSYG